MKNILKNIPFFIAFMLNGLLCCFGQKNKPADSIPTLTLDQCINYAMQNQPGLNQALLNRAVVKTTNEINLSGWLPQVNLTGSWAHYYQLPTTLEQNTVPGGPPVAVKTGIINTAIPELTASEALFSPQLLFAARSASIYITQAEQITDSAKIGIVVNASKAFYNLLLTLEQVNVLMEDTARLQRNVKDAYNQYKGGIVDETDYEEAIISLNNSKAQLKQQVENIAPGYAVLKQTIGYPPEKHFNVSFDTVQMIKDIAFDTTQALQYEKRIEYQQLQTAKRLQHELTSYYKLSSLPAVSAFYDYFYEYESNTASELFGQSYPYSYLGLSLDIPLFTGFSHFENVHRSKLEEQILDWSDVNLKSVIYTEYTTALAEYRGNIYNWRLMKDNRMQAEDAYRIVSLQYRQGVVAYLNVIVAEDNLIAAEIGYINALFNVLSSKIDLEKAMGIITYK